MNKYNPQIHHRRSIRLKEYDYTRQGVYFVTICTYRREHLFGEVVDGKMVLNPFGRVVATYWQRLPRHFPRVQLGAWVVMPNHVHGIIIITDDGDDDDGGDACRGEATPQASIYAEMRGYAEAPGQTEPGGGCLAPTDGVATPQASIYAEMRGYAEAPGQTEPGGGCLAPTDGVATPQASIYAEMRGYAEAPGQTEPGGGCLAPTDGVATPQALIYAEMRGYAEAPGQTEPGGGCLAPTDGVATPQASIYAEMRGYAEAPGQTEPGGGCLAPTDGVATTPHGAPSGSVGAMVGNVKSTITRRINQMRHTPGAMVWQRNYWERVVRTPEEHARIEDYIRLNPARWQADVLHPDAPPNPFNQEDI